MNETKCPDCGESLSKCVCCEGCGHICPLDRGEPYCPVCKPEVAKDPASQAEPSEN